MRSKKSSDATASYLKTYNFAQVIGWTYILYKFFTTDFSSTAGTDLWQNVKWPVIIFQHAAILEVIHAATGIVKSNPALTFLQVASRVLVVSYVILLTPHEYAASSSGLPLAILAWSITEIVRYLFYFMNLIDYIPYLLKWIRYTFFIVLYPVGVTGELLCIYSALNYASSNPDAFSYRLPNSWNFIFTYYASLLILMITYIPVFPQLYFHMFAQRRKTLGTSASKKAQ